MYQAHIFCIIFAFSNLIFESILETISTIFNKSFMISIIHFLFHEVYLLFVVIILIISLLSFIMKIKPILSPLKGKIIYYNLRTQHFIMYLH
jgi:hypothetical protein